MALPNGYKLVEYIENTGTQYIDTGVLGRAGIATALDFTIISGNLDDFIPMGCVQPNWSPRCYLLALQNGAFWSYALGEWQFSDVSASTGVRYLVETSLDSNLQTMKVNGTTVKTSSDSSPIDTGLNVYLFGNNYSNSYISSGTMRVYSCKIYEGNTLVRNFIPCINPSGEAGLYDIVENTFYANAGSGSFLTGSEVASGSGGKSLIEGAVYGIKGGKTLVDGTAYSIKSGKTLVGGTAYDVKFSGHPVVVAISSGSSGAMQGTPNVFSANVDGSTTTSCLKTIDSASNLTVGGGTTGCNVYLNDELVYSSDTSGMYKVDMSEATHIMVLADSVRNGQNLADARCNVYVYTYNIVDSEEVTIEIANVTGSNSLIEYNGTQYRELGSFIAKTGDVITCKPAGSNPYTGINSAAAYGFTTYWIVTAPAFVTLYFYQQMYSPPSGYVGITEIHEGDAVVRMSIGGGTNGYAPVTINGRKYYNSGGSSSNHVVVVSIGTPATCTFKRDEKASVDLKYGVYVNGVQVSSSSPYEHTIIGDTIIVTGKIKDDSGYYYSGYIEITEET